QEVVERIERIFVKNPNVEFTVSTLGTQPQTGNGVVNQGSNYAGVQATLYERGAFLDKIKGILPWHHDEEKLRWIDADVVNADLLKQVGRIPGADVTVQAAGGFSFGAPIQLSFTSDNHDLLVATSQKVRDALASGAVKGVINPQVSSKAGKPELRIFPDRLALADRGVTPQALGGAVRTLYQGDDSTKLRIAGREYDVRVLLDYADRNDPNTLATVPITYNNGAPIYLSQVAKIRQAPGLTKITRRSRAEEILVTADVLPGVEAGTINTQVRTWLDSSKLLPQGVTIRQLGSADSQAREQGGLILAFVAGLLAVYLVLASLYNNWLYPFIIQLAQPQAIVGAILG
ncbi:efflux RND transporter permease subunit, partial [bacterium]